MGKAIIIIGLIIILAYHFTDIDNQFKVMSGNLHSEKAL
jgi:hypothetical protein